MTRKRTNRAARDAAGSALMLAGQAGVVAAVRGLSSAYRGLQERRLTKLWQHVLNGVDDAAEFTQRVERALLEDGDEVAYAFVAAARAAVDAIDPSALSSIGLLARRFVNTGNPSRREYAAYLDMFETLDALELGHLRRVVKRLSEARGDVVFTTVVFTSQEYSWGTVEASADGYDLGVGGGTGALIASFRRVLAARVRPSGLGESNPPAIPREVIDLLVEVLPDGE